MTEIQVPTGREFRVLTEVWPEAEMEIRAEGEGRTFDGLAIPYNVLSEPINEGGLRFRERFMPGSMTRTLKQTRNIKMFLNHNADMLLGTTRAGTLRLAESDSGVRANADLPDTTVGRDAAELLKRGDIDSMSFGFRAVKDKWDARHDDGLPIRDVHAAELFEVSPLTGWPSYTATSAAVRHLADEIGVDAEPLQEAARLLWLPDSRLSTEQRDMLLAAINARTDEPLVAPNLARWRERAVELGLTRQ